MRHFGRICNRTGVAATGAPMMIDAPVPAAMPALNVSGDPRQLEISMSLTVGHTGVRRVMDRVQAPPRNLLYTVGAAGGCVPIAAAEITPGAPPQVSWIYMVHGHGMNEGIDLTAGGAVAANIHVVFMVLDGQASYLNATTGQDAYFAALDPRDVIPNANALLLYGPHQTLAITPAGNIGVLPGNANPAPYQAPSLCCCKCLLTTVACEALGLPDDCAELTAMRWYRDNVLAHSEQGRALVADYYETATALVARIDREPDRMAIYQKLFARFMAPTAALIGQQRFAEAEALYGRMIATLRKLG